MAQIVGVNSKDFKVAARSGLAVPINGRNFAAPLPASFFFVSRVESLYNSHDCAALSRGTCVKRVVSTFEILRCSEPKKCRSADKVGACKV